MQRVGWCVLVASAAILFACAGDGFAPGGADAAPGSEGSGGDGSPGDVADVADAAPAPIADGSVPDATAAYTPVPHSSQLVSAGSLVKSPSYKMVFTLGQPTQNQGATKSPQYRMQGGLIGATEALP